MSRRPRTKAPDLGTLKVRGRRALPLYAAVSPYYLLFALFSAAPILFTAFISVTNWSGLGDFQIIGLKNFEYLLEVLRQHPDLVGDVHGAVPHPGHPRRVGPQ